MELPHRHQPDWPQQARRRQILRAVLPHHDLVPKLPFVVASIFFDHLVGPIGFFHPADRVNESVTDPNLEEVLAQGAPFYFPTRTSSVSDRSLERARGFTSGLDSEVRTRILYPRWNVLK